MTSPVHERKGVVRRNTATESQNGRRSAHGLRDAAAEQGSSPPIGGLALADGLAAQPARLYQDGEPGAASLDALRRHAALPDQTADLAGRAGALRGGVIRRTLFDDGGIRARAEEVARGGDRGGQANWIEAKTLLRAEEIHRDGGGDEKSNYFRAQREVDEAWKEYEKLTRGDDPVALNWAIMDAALSREEFAAAVGRAEDAFTRALDSSRDLRTSTADLKAAFAGQPALLNAIDRANAAVSARKQASEVFDDTAAQATSGLLVPLTQMASLADLRSFCEQVAKIHGVSPLDAVRDFVGKASRNLPLQQAASQPDIMAVIDDVVTRFSKVVGDRIPPQPIDAGGRLTSDKKANVGSVAQHAETLHIEGNPNRQLLLGVGRPGDPQGYQDFAKDYGVWDYESWGAWNTANTSTQFANITVDPNDGAGVDTVMEGTDVNGAHLFDKLHFRLSGVFPTIPAAADKLMAALGLYNEMMNLRAADYHGKPINSLWTLGEINTIAFSPQLAARTSFYGQNGADQDKKLAELIPGSVQDMTDATRLKMDEYYAIGEDVHRRLAAHYVADRVKLNQALKRVADLYFNIPRGADWVVADTTAAVG